LFCPVCKNTELIPVLTKQGVEVEYCPYCKGIWLDKGEIFYFSKVPAFLNIELEKALENPRPSQRRDPRRGLEMVELSLMKGELVIDYCPQTEGVWLDRGELSKLPFSKAQILNVSLDQATLSEKGKIPVSLRREKLNLPAAGLMNLGIMSAGTLILLYGMITLVLVTLIFFKLLTPFAALLTGVFFALLQFLLAPFLMDHILSLFYSMRWARLSKDIPSHLQFFLKQIIKKYNIPQPRVGIIKDGAPNAFTYGHTPYDARIVLTSGLIDLLSPQEVEAVLAHEFGHIVHWDIAVMTVANVVPITLYALYKIYIRSSVRGKDAPLRIVAGCVTYLLYVISEYVVLGLSRLREYFADKFSAENTSAAKLSSALVKIGYGLAGEKKFEDDQKQAVEAVKAMGIFDYSMARAMAVSLYCPRKMGGKVDEKWVKEAVKWDLWNPWALYYEINSTHPLIAKRLKALNDLSRALEEEPYAEFELNRPESYWDEFFVDLFFKICPGLVSILAVILFFVSPAIGTSSSVRFFNFFYLKLGLLLFSFAYLIQTFYSYDYGFFPILTIRSLLKKIKVSGVRPVPCTVKGKIIGKGVPGLIWSEDFFLQDDTGIIYLDYHQPLNIWNLFFGLFKSMKYAGKEVEVEGWYRRAPAPYIEVRTLTIQNDNSKKVLTCYAFEGRIIFSAILLIIGLILVGIEILSLSGIIY